MTHIPGDRVEVLENGKWRPAVIVKQVRPNVFACESPNGDFGNYRLAEIRPIAKANT